MIFKILHISDFHYCKAKSYDSENRVSKLINAISDKEIDFIVFSGDLVCKGENSYETASQTLIDSILNKLGLTRKRILIVPGNHDLNRNAESQMVKDSLSQKNTIKDIEDFCSDEVQLKASLSRFTEYNNFIKEFYKDIQEVEIKPLYTKINLKINDEKISAIGLNSSWRCIDSEKDRGQLIYPSYLASEALSKTQDSQIVLCAMHHNLSDFKEYVSNELVDIIYPRCKFLFSGHYHKAHSSIESFDDGGLIHAISPAVYNRNDKLSQYGFCVWTLDTETHEATEEKFLLVDTVFMPLKVKTFILPLDEQKKEQIEIRQLLRLRLNEAKIRADKDFVTGEQTNQESGETFVSLFKRPVIKIESTEQLIASGKKGTLVKIDDLIHCEDSICLVGGNKCGKTAILRKIQIDTLSDVFKDKILPIFIKYKDYKSGKKLDLEKEIADYLNMSRKNAGKFILNHKILLLIDDINARDNVFIEMVSGELKKIPKSKLITTCENLFGRVSLPAKINEQLWTQYFIHEIGEQEIHELTLSWPNIPEENKYHLEEKIMSICRHMNIPFNFWTVSLFLWIFEKTDPQNIHNNFELVKLYIDELIDKAGIIRDRSLRLDYEDLKIFLGELAYKLLQNNGYRIDSEELFDFIRLYRQSNKKFDIDPLELIQLLEKKQIIEKTEHFYTFRLNGVFEFFLAFHMQDNTKFRDDVLADKEMFLSFGNELEFYAGFKRKDYESIIKIYNNIKDILCDFTSEAGYEDVDSRLSKTFSTSGNEEIATVLAEAVNNISDDEKREIIYQSSPILPIDNRTQIQVKKLTDFAKPIDTADIERALFILGRVFRNSNICDKNEISDEMIDFILTGVCNLGFRHSKGIKDFTIPDEKNADTIKQIIDKINNIMPVVVAAFLNDAISQRNLTRVFVDKLNHYYKKHEGNEYRIFLLTQILTYMDLNDFSYWEKSLAITGMKALRFSYYTEAILIRFTYPDNKGIARNAEGQINLLLPEFNKNQPEKKEIIKNIFKDIDNLKIAKENIRKEHYGKCKKNKKRKKKKH